MFEAYPSPFAPLPGTVPSPRGLFIDRWGTLLVTPEAGYARNPTEIEFFEGAVEAVFRASRVGWNIYLLGNEDAVAHGRLSRDAWVEIETAFLEHLRARGVEVRRCYTCLDHPEGVEGQRADSVYLLPNTGAFYHAFHTDGTELRRSWVIGDSTVELVAGWRAGCRLAAVESGLGLSDATFHVDPEVRGATLVEVLTTLLASEDPAKHRA